jgi:hypothetical protein
MNNKPILNKPKYMSIKIFIFSLTLSMILWLWGIFSTRDLINNAMNQASPLPNPSVAITNPVSNTTQPSAALRKVQVPTPVPVTTVNTNRLPMTNTGSSRP